MPDRTVAESTFSHIINAPVGRVDIADWLLHLTSAEYERCRSPAHIAAGVSATDDGTPMVINVEVIGGSLLINKYVAETSDAHHCRMLSISDVLGPLGCTTSHLVWDLSVEPIDAESCEYINHVKAVATDEFLAFLDEHGIPFERAAATHQEASVAHNEKETALYAESIERRTLAKRTTATGRVGRSPW